MRESGPGRPDTTACGLRVHALLGRLLQGVATCAAAALAVLLLTRFYGTFPRWDLLAVWGVLAVCLAVAAWCGTGERRRSLSAVYAHAVARARAGASRAPAGPAASRTPAAPPLPRRLPRTPRMHRRGSRGLMLTVLVLPLAGLLLAGPAERTRQVEEMARGASAVEEARIVELSGIEEHEGSKRRTYFTAEARVRVAGDEAGGGFRTTAVRTLDRPVPGDEVWVLYSPGRPELGAVSDDPDDLRKLLRGGAVPTVGLVLALVGAGLTLVLSLAIAYSGGGGLRRRIRSIDESGCAVRVRVAGGADYSGRTGAVSTGFRFGGAGRGGAGRERAGNEETGSAASGGASEKTVPCLVLATPEGEEAPFVIESYAAAETAAAAIGPEDAWLYIKNRPEPKPSDGADTPQARLRENRPDVRAVLIGDSGWMLRGLLPTPAAPALLPRTQRPVTDPAHRVREIDLHRAWPALLRTPALLCAGVVLLGVAGCLVLPQTVPHLVSCGVAITAGLAYDNAYRSYRKEEASRQAGEPFLEPR